MTFNLFFYAKSTVEGIFIHDDDYAFIKPTFYNYGYIQMGLTLLHVEVIHTDTRGGHCHSLLHH